MCSMCFVLIHWPMWFEELLTVLERFLLWLSMKIFCSEPLQSMIFAIKLKEANGNFYLNVINMI